MMKINLLKMITPDLNILPRNNVKNLNLNGNPESGTVRNGSLKKMARALAGMLMRKKKKKKRILDRDLLLEEKNNLLVKITRLSNLSSPSNSLKNPQSELSPMRITLLKRSLAVTTSRLAMTGLPERAMRTSLSPD